MFSPDDKDQPLPGPTEGTFTGDPVNEYSIGNGASDQGFEGGEELRDDEFRNDETGKETVLDKENTVHQPPPTHGLVEEGPGPDA